MKIVSIFCTLVMMVSCENNNKFSNIQISRGAPVTSLSPGFGNSFYINFSIAGTTDTEKCSAVLLSKRIFLTAAHCFPKLNPGLPGKGVGLFPRLDQLSGNTLVYDKINFNVLRHPQYQQELFNHDIAVGYLVEDAPIGYFGRVIETDLSKLNIGQPLEIVGFGRTALSTQAGKTFSSIKRVLTAISQFPSMNNMLVFSELNEEMACGGDSGGPAYVKSTSGEYKIAGIAQGAIGYGWCGDNQINLYTTPATYINWVQSAISLLTSNSEVVEFSPLGDFSARGNELLMMNEPSWQTFHCTQGTLLLDSLKQNFQFNFNNIQVDGSLYPMSYQENESYFGVSFVDTQMFFLKTLNQGFSLNVKRWTQSSPLITENICVK